MRLHDLRPADGARHGRKRLGRGNATGQGTTAGKGTKGQKARSGGFKAGFQGVSSRNQRMPKRRGFTNIFKTTYQVINVDKLSHFESGATVDMASLKQVGLIHNEKMPVKILGNGELTVAVNVVNVKLSESARQKIEAAGGSVTPSVATEPTATEEAIE